MQIEYRRVRPGFTGSWETPELTAGTGSKDLWRAVVPFITKPYLQCPGLYIDV